MATKTEKLLAALLQRGYKEVEHIANATCLHGVTPHNGKEIWLWLDKVGGARYSRTSKKGERRAPFVRPRCTRSICTTRGATARQTSPSAEFTGPTRR